MTQRDYIESLQKAAADMWDTIVKQYEIYEDLEYFFDKAVTVDELDRIQGNLDDQQQHINICLASYGVIMKKIEEACRLK